MNAAPAGAPEDTGRVSTPLRRASDFELIPVGDTRRTGRARVRDAVWSMDAAGLEKDKGFHFACRALDGDGVLVARVVSVGGAAPAPRTTTCCRGCAARRGGCRGAGR